MRIMSTLGSAIMGGLASLIWIAVALCDEPTVGKRSDSNDNSPSATELAVDDADRVEVAVARDRAKLMHEVYTATLDVIHERYFHGERAIIPARAMEDVFAEMNRRSKAEARWISVNVRAMSIHHEPKTAFEKRAAEVIADGQAEFELVENGYYRRAGAIPLADSCVSCHAGFFRENSKRPKFAGLVISVPVKPVTAAK